jgi:hypothetical protein
MAARTSSASFSFTDGIESQCFHRNHGPSHIHQVVPELDVIRVTAELEFDVPHNILFMQAYFLVLGVGTRVAVYALWAFINLA